VDGDQRPPLRLFFSPSPGRYNYCPEDTLPQSTFYNGNYWVDVVFTPSAVVPPVTFSISGNAALPLTTLTLSGSVAGVTTADENGNYTFPEVPNGSYVVAPSLPGYAFRPPLVPVLVSAAPVSGINFMALRIPRVSLSWAPSVSPNKGYFVYRGTTPGGPYLKLNANPLSGTTYDDSNIELDQTYFYVTTALGIYDIDSAFSNEAIARIAIEIRACCN